MATERSAELPDQPASRLCWPGADTEPGPSPAECEEHKFSACSEGQSANPWSCGQPAFPPRRGAGTEERLPRRTEPERSSGRRGGRDSDTRKGWLCLSVALQRSALFVQAAGPPHTHSPTPQEQVARRPESGSPDFARTLRS